MTKLEIEDYLYFFWAPLLKSNGVAAVDMDRLQQMILLTMSQATVHIEAAGYVAFASSREYAPDIVNEVALFRDKIFDNIPARTMEDSYWLRVNLSALIPELADFSEPQLQVEESFGPYPMTQEKFIGFSFYYLTHQLKIQLPATAEISAVVSLRTAIVIPDGVVGNIDMGACTLWLLAIHLDSSAADAAFYVGFRLKSCNILFDGGYNKSGNSIAAGLLNLSAGYVITCVPDDEEIGDSAKTISAGNTVIYPNKFVFSCRNRLGVPLPPRITLTQAGPISAQLFGCALSSLPVDNLNGKWVSDKKVLSIPLELEQQVFEATSKGTAAFSLKGTGKIVGPAWHFPVVSINNPLGIQRLGAAADNGYIAFDVTDEFTVTWNNLENSSLKLRQFFLRSSPEATLINYTFESSPLARQQVQLWQGGENQKGRSVVDVHYSAAGNGSLTSRRTSYDLHTTRTSIDVDIDRPVLSSGERIFLKTSAVLMLINNNETVTAVVAGEKMNPAVAFESSAYKSLSSFALSNALIQVRPADIFFLTGTLSAGGIVSSGQCFVTFPVPFVEHTLPDPYITSLFDEQPARDENVNPANKLRATIRWSESAEAELTLELTDASGNVFTPKPSLADEAFANVMLNFPLQHPAERAYEDLLRSSISAKLGNVPFNIVPDVAPYGTYQSIYHSKTNTVGAFSMLHILPGNAALVDVSGRASQMGIAFSRRFDHAENGVGTVIENTGYTFTQTYRIEKNEIVSSGRFVRAFTLPHVQWEPVYFDQEVLFFDVFAQQSPFPTHGVPTRIASANKEDIALAPIPVTNFIVDSFQEDQGKYAAAAHFALPFGMNVVALFHPFVEGVRLPPVPRLKRRVPIAPDPYSFSTINFNQPDFKLRKAALSGAIQVKVTSEPLPDIPRNDIKFPDPSFHGSVVQMPKSFGIVPAPLNYTDDSILGTRITKQFNKVMWGEYLQEAGINPISLKFRRSANAKVPLRRVDFSGFGASVFSNWLNKYADAGSVSQVKFNILIGRVAHEVVQIKSVIIPWFVPVVRTLILERKNHGNIIRTDTGWVATGPGEFHVGYRCHPGVVRGVYDVTSIRDTEIKLQQTIDAGTVEMAGVYFDADVKMENVVSGFNKASASAEGRYRLVSSKKQFGYILLGNPDDGVPLQAYFTDNRLQEFMSRADVGPLGGPVDCVVNIAGSGQRMHVTRVDVMAASAAKASVAAARGTLQLSKGGSWSVVKKVTNGATLPLTNDETVPLIRNGELQFQNDSPAAINFGGSRHVLGNPKEIEKYAKNSSVLAGTEYALLQSTDTQKLMFLRPSFDSNNDAVINANGIADGVKQIFVTNPVLADPYSLLKNNALFPDGTDVLTLKNGAGILADTLDIVEEAAGISFPSGIATALEEFVPPECAVGGRKLTIVKSGSFEIYLDYGGGLSKNDLQKFTVALNGKDDNKRWQMVNRDVAIVVCLGSFQPLLTVKGNFNAEAGKRPEFTDARIVWNDEIEAIKKIIEVLSILYQLSKPGSDDDLVSKGFRFTMGNSPDSWSYKCNIEEKIPVIKFPSAVQLAQLPGPAPLILEAGLNLGVFFNLSLSADPSNLIKPGAGVSLGFEATIQVLLLTIEVATVYGVGSARIDIFIELPDAKPTFKFTMGFGATVAVQLPVVAYVSLTRVISLGAYIDDGMEMTVGQMLRGVITVAGGLASVTVQVEASGTVTNKGNAEPPDTKWTATVRGVFTLDVTVAFVLSWDFSKDFEHEIDLPNPTKFI